VTDFHSNLCGAPWQGDQHSGHVATTTRPQIDNGQRWRGLSASDRSCPRRSTFLAFPPLAAVRHGVYDSRQRSNRSAPTRPSGNGPGRTGRDSIAGPEAPAAPPSKTADQEKTNAIDLKIDSLEPTSIGRLRATDSIKVTIDQTSGVRTRWLAIEVHDRYRSRNAQISGRSTRRGNYPSGVTASP